MQLKFEMQLATILLCFLFILLRHISKAIQIWKKKNGIKLDWLAMLHNGSLITSRRRIMYSAHTSACTFFCIFFKNSDLWNLIAILIDNQFSAERSWQLKFYGVGDKFSLNWFAKTTNKQTMNSIRSRWNRFAHKINIT